MKKLHVICYLVFFVTHMGCRLDDNSIRSHLPFQSKSLALTINNSASLNKINHTSFELSGTCSHPSQNVSLSVGACGVSKVTTCQRNFLWSQILDFSSCSDGEHTLSVAHQSSSGEIKTILTQLTKDTLSPVLKLDYPTSQSPIGYYSKIEGACSEENLPVSIQLSDGSTLISKDASCTSGRYLEYIDTSSLAATSITVSVEQKDVALNSTPLQLTLLKPTTACDSLANRSKMNASGFSGGNGTVTDPYLLCTSDQLADMQYLASAHYKLASDIYFEVGDSNGDFLVNGSDTDFISGFGWTPISSFTGSFDGGQHAISGLTINRPSEANVGLFALTNNGSSFFKNINFYKATVTGDSNVGALVGGVFNYGGTNIQFINCWNCSISGTTEYIGGLIGYYDAYGVMNNLVFSGVVSGGNTTGGLSGRILGGGLFASKFSGTVTGGDRVGGLVGTIIEAIVKNSYAENVVVNATGSSVGGLAGLIGWGSGSIEKSYVSGTVSGDGNLIGCALGYNNGGHIANIMALCDSVTGNSEVSYVGPLVGNTNGALGTGFYSGEMNCTNYAAAPCNTLGSIVGLKSEFYDKSLAHFDKWDFYNESTDGLSDIWVEQTNAPPKLYFEETINYINTLNGSGTLLAPYEVTSAADLLKISSHPFYQFSHIQLMNNVDILDSPTFNGLFREIPFQGHFNGQGFLANNLSLTGEDSKTNLMGLFGAISGYGSVQNLDVDVFSIFNASTMVGGLAGLIASNGNITKIKILGGPINALGGAGGLAGVAMANINKSSSIININCSNWYSCGGFIGHLTGSGLVEDSYATGNIISVVNNTGGFVGAASYSTITRSFSSGNSNSNNVRSGGFAGYIYQTSISDSYSSGNTLGDSAANDIGAFVGASSLCILTNVHHLAASTCTNNGVGICNSSSVPQAAFTSQNHTPMDSWDFATVWFDLGGVIDLQ